jgi:S1-C subfamily serine protease
MQSRGFTTIRRAFSAIMLASLLVFGGSTGASVAEPNAELGLQVIVVDELMQRPVPLTDFILKPIDPKAKPIAFRTDEQGRAIVKGEPGEYDLQNIRPLQYKGRSLVWSKRVKLEAGAKLDLKLTDADAVITEVSKRQVGDEAKIYQKLRNGVVTVESDFGHGSGFIVSSEGLVLTNQHVVNNSRRVTLRIRPGLRVEASIIAEGKASDVALLRFNPATFPQLVVIPISKATGDELVTEGERVLAIGSPLSQEKIVTTGIISKVDGDVVTSDININPGNSGGPLLNYAGEAIGVTTFIEKSPSGPGISGIVSINRARPLLAAAQQQLTSRPLPSQALLPDISPIPIPTDALDAAAQVDRKPFEIKDPKHFVTQIATPFVRASLEAAEARELAKGRKRRKDSRDQADPGGPRNVTRTFYNKADAVVIVVVAPALTETSGSKNRAVAGALFGVRTKAEFGFREDFEDMRLLRGTKEIEPLRRQRVPVSILMDLPGLAQGKDLAYAGVYFFDPSAFEPGEQLVLNVYREAEPDRGNPVKIDKKTQQRIWDEFAPWREAVSKAQR